MTTPESQEPTQATLEAVRAVARHQFEIGMSRILGQVGKTEAPTVAQNDGAGIPARRQIRVTIKPKA